jgi:two-component system chemotaxis response regulator CheV
MAGFIASVDARTRLAGHNRLELLLFSLGDKQRFGINVFKVREVIRCPPLTSVPKSHPVVRGIVNIRGRTISVLDLGLAVGRASVSDTGDAFVVVTEYSGKVQGFLVSSVDRIVNQNWKEILPPPKGGASAGYLTAVTQLDQELVQIIDVERVLTEVVGLKTEVSPEYTDASEANQSKKRLVLVADDSVVARSQIQRTLEQIGCEIVLAHDGEEALHLLKTWWDEDAPERGQLGLVISDIEMPRMDGYTLTSQIRQDERLRGLKVILHTSLSGGFNQAMVDKVGADEFISKFESDLLAATVIKHLDTVHES